MTCYIYLHAFEEFHLKRAIPVLDAFLEGTFEGAEGHSLRHGDVLVKEGHVVVDSFQDARSCLERAPT